MAAARSLAQFQKAFSDEANCAAFMFKRRWPDGFVCPACGKGRFAALKSRPRLFECLDCGRQTSVTAGTALHRSKLPLTTWFWAAHLMTTHSNGMSALQLQDQLGVTYKTAWLLTQKLRRSMFDPDREPLEGVVEIDQAEIPFRVGDTFFESNSQAVPHFEWPDSALPALNCDDARTKMNRITNKPEPAATIMATDADFDVQNGDGLGVTFENGNAGKLLVIGAVEVVERDTGKAKPRRKHAKYLDTRSGRIRLAMIADNSAASIEAFVKANVKRGTTLLTDGHKSFPGLKGYRHDPRVVGKMAAHIVLPWIHRAFSLLKRWSLGAYHGLRRKHVDTYLNEFVFRYNRRFYRHVSFETLLGLAADKKPASYWDFIKRDNPRKSPGRSRATPIPHIDEPESTG